jgi:hypothetical protein
VGSSIIVGLWVWFPHEVRRTEKNTGCTLVQLTAFAVFLAEFGEGHPERFGSGGTQVYVNQWAQAAEAFVLLNYFADCVFVKDCLSRTEQ